MGVVRLEKIKLFGVRKELDSFLEELQKLGIVEVRKLEQESYRKVRLESETTLSRLERILPILEAHSNFSFSDRTKIRTISPLDFFFKQASLFTDNSKLVEKIDLVYQELTDSESKIQEILDQLEILDAVKSADFAPELLKEDTYVRAVMGRIADSSLNDLERIAQIFPFDFEILSKTDGFIYILGFYYRDFARNVLDELKLLEFQEWSGPLPKEGSFKNLFHGLCTEKHQLSQKVEDLRIQLRIFSQDVNSLHIFYDYLSNRVQKDLIQFQVVNGPFLFEIEGYIPTSSLGDLDLLLDRFSGCGYEKVELEEQEELPSFIRNSRVSRPFEFVTDMFSRPGKEDLDPTPFFAPFFAIFMGIAIGDAGQGILLAAFAWFVKSKMRISVATKKLLGICFYGGLMAIVIGVLTGTYFAIPFEDFGLHIPYLYKPEKQVMLALLVSFVWGFIHITFAYCIKFFHLLSQKRVFDAIFDGLTHIIVMLCGFMLVLGLYFPSLHVLLPITKYLFIVDILVIWATAGRHYSDAFVGRVLWGLYGVYELTSIFGDLLSYARLFALGLAGGIIGSAINQLTPQLLTGIHFSSIGSSIYALFMIIVFLLILIIGHIFTMLIGILGAFIHTMRLQFVEFFGKFFQGGGVAFRPFQIQSKYFWIKKHQETIEE